MIGPPSTIPALIEIAPVSFAGDGNTIRSTAVAAYSTRALPQASVSTPLEWDELSEGLRSDHFTVDNLRHRLGFLKQDPWQDMGRLKQKLPDAKAVQRSNSKPR